MIVQLLIREASFPRRPEGGQAGGPQPVPPCNARKCAAPGAVHAPSCKTSPSVSTKPAPEDAARLLAERRKAAR